MCGTYCKDGVMVCFVSRIFLLLFGFDVVFLVAAVLLFTWFVDVFMLASVCIFQHFFWVCPRAYTVVFMLATILFIESKRRLEYKKPVPEPEAFCSPTRVGVRVTCTSFSLFYFCLPKPL